MSGSPGYHPIRSGAQTSSAAFQSWRFAASTHRESAARISFSAAESEVSAGAADRLAAGRGAALRRGTPCVLIGILLEAGSLSSSGLAWGRAVIAVFGLALSLMALE